MPIEEDYDPYPPQLSLINERKNYRVEVVPLHTDDPALAEEWYWHLYYKDEHINGGISDFWDRAYSTATQYKMVHQRQHFLNSFVWDEESLRWHPREYFMQ